MPERHQWRFPTHPQTVLCFASGWQITRKGIAIALSSWAKHSPVRLRRSKRLFPAHFESGRTTITPSPYRAGDAPTHAEVVGVALSPGPPLGYLVYRTARATRAIWVRRAKRRMASLACTTAAGTVDALSTCVCATLAGVGSIARWDRRRPKPVPTCHLPYWLRAGRDLMLRLSSILCRASCEAAVCTTSSTTETGRPEASSQLK